MKKPLGEQLVDEMNRSRKQKDPYRFFYYKHLLQNGVVSAVSWETFQGSWAHSEWIKQHDDEIYEMIQRDNKRFPITWR